MHLYIYTYAYVHMYMYLCTCTCAYIHVHMYLSTYVPVHMYHPPSHSQVHMYQQNVSRVPSTERAEVYCQFADARLRLQRVRMSGLRLGLRL